MVLSLSDTWKCDTLMYYALLPLMSQIHGWQLNVKLYIEENTVGLIYNRLTLIERHVLMNKEL